MCVFVGGRSGAYEKEFRTAKDIAIGDMVAEAKALCRALAGADPSEAADMTANALADRWETEETRAGIEAFFERRDPPWRAG